MDPDTLINKLSAEFERAEIELRLSAYKRLKSIATALGPEDTCSKLIALLNSRMVHEEEDEVLLELAEQLGDFPPLLGDPANCKLLLPMLQQLCRIEETVVRDAAGASLCKIGQILPESLLLEFVQLIKDLCASSEWISRATVCAVFATAYERVKDNSKIRTELRTWFFQLCKDETPMVKRAAARHLGKFANTIEPEFLKTELLPVYVDLTLDAVDSVVLIALEASTALAKLLPKADTTEIILPIILKMSQNKSWTMRHVVATEILAIAEAIGAEQANEQLIPAYVALLQDVEAAVREAAVGKAADDKTPSTGKTTLPDMCRFVVTHERTKEAAIHQIMPCVKEIAQDPQSRVRIAFGAIITDLAPTLGKQNTVEQLVPICLSLLNDEDISVKLSLLEKLPKLVDVIGIEIFSQSLLTSILNLAEDEGPPVSKPGEDSKAGQGRWYVKRMIIQQIPWLSQHLGQEFCDQKVLGLCLSWLQDPIHGVRQAACENLKALCEAFGAEWTVSKIVPSVLDAWNASKRTKSTYLTRMTYINCFKLLVPHIKSDVLAQQVLPALLEAFKDSVPNIKFAAATAVGEFIKHVDGSVFDSQIKGPLTELTSDPDFDVRHFASMALKNR
mmetsp:Transcript_38622/g.46750  ORF Transcript_38622/g.46750 Transcript_38622/m.46750 type:complete len:619 (-) Transcript_38622:409-2265(-)